MPRILKASTPFLVGTATLTLAACGAPEADPRTLPPLVRVETAKPTQSDERAFTGVVSARVQSDLGFRVAGKIAQRLVDIGETVRRGQVLMRMDPLDLALQRAAQDKAVAAAQARAAQAVADEQRYRDLISAGAVSASAYDQAKAAALSAQAQFDAARAQARIAGNALDYAVLRADADGVVVETLAEPGQVVTAGQAVLRLAHAGPREAAISLPETVRPAVGSVGTALLYDGATRGKARLRQLSDAADPRTRTYDARYVLEGPAAAAPLGSTVRITLASPQSRPVMSVPLAAIHDGGLGPGVWVLTGKDNRVAWRPVAISAIGEENASVRTGLKPGERFVAMGAHLLHPGQSVTIAPTRGAVQ